MLSEFSNQHSAISIGLIVENLSVQSGTILRQYQIVEPLGAGSMGVVYRALDTRLGRHVAIKMLPERLSSDAEARERFEREARAIAALSHPGIVTIYEFTRAEDTLFAVMELLEGETLRSRLLRGPMPWRTAVEIAASVSDGLAAAHGKEVIHRDLKPENIFLPIGQGPKILDFGLARQSAVLPSSADDSATYQGTVPGIVLGTIGYMSPEQVQGLPADARSDLFALGCVLYEMLTARRPFAGQTPQEIMAATLRDPTPQLPILDPPAPSELARVIDHCLAKEPERRFSTARDTAFALRALLTGSGAAAVAGKRRVPRGKSIAVLPFQHTGSGDDLEYLGDGLAESIINSLSQLPGLRVVPRGSVFRYKGVQADPGAVGLALNARTLLTGRIAQRGDLLNVQAELVDTATESQLWGEQYRRPLAELQGVQEEIAWHITEALRIRLTGEQKKRLTRKKTGSGDAYQEHLRGRYHWNRWTPEGFRSAAEHFERALALDPSYAPAWAGLGDTYGALAFYHLVDASEGWPRARDAAIRAVQLDENLPDAHATLALGHMFHSWSWIEAEQEFKRAIELNPSHGLARSFYGMLLGVLLRREAGLEESRRAVELEPLSLLFNMNVGWSLYQARQYSEAIRQAHHILELDPGFHEAHAIAATACERLGDFPRAARYVTGAMQNLGARIDQAATLAMPLATQSAEAYWRSRIAMMNAVPGARERAPQIFIAAHIGLGETDIALELMERLVQQRVGHCVFFQSDPIYEGLKGSPRYEAIIARVFGTPSA
jgi:eukaryotic-like serine/threonine-protein kinase